ncbi:N-6 DNA methylase [Ursidibacter sp. B-7004-1]
MTKDLLKLFEKFKRHDKHKVFHDFVALIALEISFPFQRRTQPERVKMYHTLKDQYDDEEHQLFRLLFQEVINKMEEQIADVLGQLYMELGIANKSLGQCFTPTSIGTVMADIATPSANVIQQQIDEKGYFTMYEPSCGSGMLIISLIKKMRNLGFNPQTQLFVMAQDLDLKSVHMLYIQLSLLGIPAIISHSDTLEDSMTKNQWKTPFFFLSPLNLPK